MLDVIKQVSPILQKYWGNKIKIAHGGICNFKEEDQFKYRTIKTTEIVKKLLEEENSKLFVVGDWDLFVCNLTESETMQLCHESDLHFEFINETAMNEIKLKLTEILIAFTEMEETKPI